MSNHWTFECLLFQLVMRCSRQSSRGSLGWLWVHARHLIIFFPLENTPRDLTRPSVCLSLRDITKAHFCMVRLHTHNKFHSVWALSGWTHGFRCLGICQCALLSLVTHLQSNWVWTWKSQLGNIHSVCRSCSHIDEFLWGPCIDQST